MTDITVDIRVNRILREFIMSTNGSDTLVPQKDDTLWLIVKANLITVPGDFRIIPEDQRQEYVRVKLLDCSGSKTYARKGDGRQQVYMNPLYRCYLDESGQRRVEKHLHNAFKECFHNFVQGAVQTNPEISQKEAIEEFCEMYRIGYDAISYDMLRKSWYRSGQYRSFLGSLRTFCPLIL